LKEALKETGYWKRDNLALEICENISDSDLVSIDKKLLKLLLDSMWDLGTKTSIANSVSNPLFGSILAQVNKRDYKQIIRLKGILQDSEDNKW
jgi:hypothetical protein